MYLLEYLLFTEVFILYPRKIYFIAIALPDLKTLVGAKTKTGNLYELGGCFFEAIKDDCKSTFLPEEESCKDRLSIAKLFGSLIKLKKLKDITKDFIPEGVFQVERFILDTCVGNIEFETKAKESFDIVKDKLKVCFIDSL